MTPGLTRMRKIEVVVRAEDLDLVETALEGAGLPGWTMIRDVAGKGHDGFHQGRTLFSDRTGLVMFVGVAPDDAVTRAAEALATMFRSHAGVLFLSDVEVIRSSYFQGQSDLEAGAA